MGIEWGDDTVGWDESGSGKPVELQGAVNSVVRENPDKVQEARKRPELAGWFVGKVMAATGGRYTVDEVRFRLANRGIGARSLTAEPSK